MDHRITHTCGHEQTHFIAGFASQQERKATWLRTTVCGACYRKQRRIMASTLADNLSRLPRASGR